MTLSTQGSFCLRGDWTPYGRQWKSVWGWCKAWMFRGSSREREREGWRHFGLEQAWEDTDGAREERGRCHMKMGLIVCTPGHACCSALFVHLPVVPWKQL